MLHDPKTVNESDFDQETEEKIAPQFIAQLDLANCKYVQQLIAKKRKQKSEKKYVQLTSSFKAGLSMSRFLWIWKPDLKMKKNYSFVNIASGQILT